jgi:hypothetical protein
MINPKTKNLIFGILAGLITYAMIGSFGLFMLRFSWADYAIASKDKSYTLTMMILRLSVGILAAIIAGISATKIAVIVKVEKTTNFPKPVQLYD